MKNRFVGMLGLGIAMAALSTWPAKGQEPGADAGGWRAQLNQELPLLGHRNWILIVDSAYPLQSSPGIETIETGANEDEVTRIVLAAIDRSIHVRPVVYMDAELPFVPEKDAPGVATFRDGVKVLLGDAPIHSLPHEQLLQKVHETSGDFRVLILKTNETIPYTSVFLQLNCKYWSDDAEARLRAAMKHTAGGAH